MFKHVHVNGLGLQFIHNGFVPTLFFPTAPCRYYNLLTLVYKL